MPAAHRIRLAAIFLISCFLFATFATAQTVVFSRSVITAPGSNAPIEHPDLNNDGREDFVGAVTGGITVTLSTGDGAYAAPVTYTTGDGASPYRITIADVNNDGWADILANAGTNKIYEFVNNGDGTFHLQATFLTTGKAGAMAMGDLNHDGQPDLAFVMENDSTNPPTFTLEIWRGNGNNGFDPLSSTPAAAIGFAFVGNFDGDGNADVMLEDHDYGTTVEILYGDGAGHFPAHQMIYDNPGFQPYDLNGDGTQDLVGVPFDFSTNGSRYYQQVHALLMNGRSTPTTKDIPLQRCATGPPAVGDFNGDGIPDIAVIEHSDCQGSTPDYVSVLLGNSDGTYQPEQDIYQSSVALSVPVVIRGNHDTKADLVVQEVASGNAGGPPSYVFLNQTSGSFPSCPAPDAFTGINVCLPGSSASGSPVHFGIGAAGQTIMRKVEVWVDGTKMGQQLVKNFSHYAYFDQDLSLSNGTHTVDIYTAGYDNLLQHKSFQVTVGSSGGGGSCPVPSTPGVNICSPANGSTVTSPIHILASGKNTGTTAGMDVWLDGTKVGWYSGTNTVDTQVYVSPGNHRLDVYARGTNGELQEATSYFVVPSNTNCPAPSSSGGIDMCSPVNGSTISSPLHVIATGGSAVDTIEVWIDGNKIAQEVGAKGSVTFDLEFPLSAGSHRVHLNAKSSGVLTYGITSYFTVQ